MFKKCKHMSRRSAIIVRQNLNNVQPLSLECQVCNKYDSLYSCKICNRITCFRCKMICNKNIYCKLCYFENEVNSLIIFDFIEENKVTLLKQLKKNIIYFFSCVWINKSQKGL